jgi:cytochrome d ubiquinol oxidase subunit II
LIDYDTLKLLWWIFIGVLLIGFAVTDGFDLGAGALLPFLGRSDAERGAIVNAIGPTWEGNQVWLITAGGAVFAAWPPVYAAAFSCLHVALLLMLFTLFLRPVGFEYRNKVADPRWRRVWDWGVFTAAVVPSLVFGVAFGNLMRGLPFHFDAAMHSHYDGSFSGLLNPFALLVGVVSLSMLVMHGAVFLSSCTEGEIQLRAERAARAAGGVFIISFAAAGIWLVSGIAGFHIEAMPTADAVPNILAKTVTVVRGDWMDNYGVHPWMLLAPAVAYTASLMVIYTDIRRRPVFVFLCGTAVQAGVILTAGFSLFPFIIPSSTDPASSLTVWDATSSQETLTWMFWVTLVCLPVVLAYTAWMYRVMRGRVTARLMRRNGDTLY